MSYTLKVILLSAVIECSSGVAYDRDSFSSYLPPTQFNRPFPLPLSFPRFQQIVPFEVRLQDGVPPRRRPGYFPSCQKRCNVFGHNENAPCQCNAFCVDYGDCCPDFQRACLSCEGRCFSKFTQRAPCQCNRQCERFQNCCEDFTDECISVSESSEDTIIPGVAMLQICYCNYDGNKYYAVCDGLRICRLYVIFRLPRFVQGEVITDPELASFAEEILSLDVNNVAAHVTINLQGKTPAGGPDNAPDPLLTISPDAYRSLTLAKLIPLLDNYIPVVGTPELVTPEEEQEEKDFQDAIFSTSIMKRTEEFLATKGLVPAADFRAKLTEIWFGLYTRSGGALGSSGFEHIFVGELKKGVVSGYHGWVSFAQEEAKNDLNYNGYISTVSLGSKGLMISHTFDWLNTKKPISSMFIGTSPEFELALFTVCWFARPNARCPITLNGNKLYIQTYDITFGGKKYVASAYPDN